MTLCVMIFYPIINMNLNKKGQIKKIIIAY